jgi:hypothetical protein
MELRADLGPTANGAETPSGERARAPRRVAEEHESDDPGRNAWPLLAAQLFVLGWSVLRLRLVAVTGMDLDACLALVVTVGVSLWLAATWIRSRPYVHDSRGGAGPKPVRRHEAEPRSARGNGPGRLWVVDQRGV